MNEILLFARFTYSSNFTFMLRLKQVRSSKLRKASVPIEIREGISVLLDFRSTQVSRSTKAYRKVPESREKSKEVGKNCEKFTTKVHLFLSNLSTLYKQSVPITWNMINSISPSGRCPRMRFEFRHRKGTAFGILSIVLWGNSDQTKKNSYYFLRHSSNPSRGRVIFAPKIAQGVF